MMMLSFVGKNHLPRLLMPPFELFEPGTPEWEYFNKIPDSTSGAVDGFVVGNPAACSVVDVSAATKDVDFSPAAKLPAPNMPAPEMPSAESPLVQSFVAKMHVPESPAHESPAAEFPSVDMPSIFFSILLIFYLPFFSFVTFFVVLHYCFILATLGTSCATSVHQWRYFNIDCFFLFCSFL
jgi:hypothetical protein